MYSPAKAGQAAYMRSFSEIKRTMMKYAQIYTLFLLFVSCTLCQGQNSIDLLKDTIHSIPTEIITSQGPSTMVRTIMQDRKGNIWLASSEGIIRYDGKSFTNITSKLSSDRFFSVLEDRKGNFWFGTRGSGVYYYDGKSFQHYTTKEGLVNDLVFTIYEDKTGNIWFGGDGGVSRYDGKYFRNFTTKEGLPHNDVNSIIEDKTGKFWFGTWGNAFIYDGKSFTVFRDKDGKTFNKVWSIIEDKKGNIWLGGVNGLWRYDGSSFTKFTPNTVLYVYEDKKGNIWTSSLNDKRIYVLSRYDGKSLSNKKPTVTEITRSLHLWAIFEANDESIWFGAFDGVYRYDGITITDFKGKEAQE